ncbi:predicted protein [Lichtheimia corymbifera JMRC:FSU:9682]|uniref:Uncharacterized protein n=1 Tax=Lichtheimia corymbifera JMRC:FSU:9682 TaxID=1263082 RepID=A0A068SAL7_9FUNG|nr:predicted protein [Lichtheimia corymbifera JMRC:FSU:9682]
MFTGETALSCLSIPLLVLKPHKAAAASLEILDKCPLPTLKREDHYWRLQTIELRAIFGTQQYEIRHLQGWQSSFKITRRATIALHVRIRGSSTP